MATPDGNADIDHAFLRLRVIIVTISRLLASGRGRHLGERFVDRHFKCLLLSVTDAHPRF